MKKQVLFRFIAILLPILLILLIELGLRLAGYGQDYALFHRIHEEGKPDYLVMNDHIAGKYFKDNGLKSDNQTDLFLKNKTDKTFRIFVQGASTVVGFPFYRGGSFPRMLKQRLSLSFPNKNIEVINTGITAVNSFTLWDQANEIIDQNPDLVIIYAGHNEYYGALGVGSSITYGSHPGLIRAYLFLKQFRFYQLLEKGFQKLKSSSSKNPELTTQETTLMEVMAKNQDIPYKSEVFNSGVNQYKSNMNLLLKKYKAHGIPVILSTLVSNEKDVKPFISEPIPDKENFLKDLKSNPLKAANWAKNNASAAYQLGRYYLKKQQDSAKKYLDRAKELDRLRFRAPDTINAIIKNFSKEYQLPLVDMKSIFENHSDDHIIGNDLLTEHVHPNVKGQFLMADAFFNKIKHLGLIGSWDHAVSYEDAYNDIPVTLIDSIKGKLIVNHLKKSWPYDLRMSGKLPMNDFVDISNYENYQADQLYKKIVSWDQVMALSYNRYMDKGEYTKALHVSESLIFEYSEQGRVYQMAGDACEGLKNFKRAIYYYSKNYELEGTKSGAELLAKAYLKNQQQEQAKKVLTAAKANGLDVMPFESLKGK